MESSNKHAAGEGYLGFFSLWLPDKTIFYLFKLYFHLFIVILPYFQLQ